MTNISPAALRTRVHGTGAGIVLAHGASGSIESNYGTLIPQLAANHTVIASDYPAVDEPLELDALADALIAEAVGNGVKTFTLIGFSLGTTIAVRAAVRHPERVKGLVLAAGLARADNRVRLAMRIWADSVRHGERETLARFVLYTAFSADYIDALPAARLAELVAAFAEGIRPGTPAQVDLVRAVDTTADLARVDVPTLVINATADRLIDPDNSRLLAKEIANAEYVEIDAGHVLMVEKPEEWARTVTEFLARRGL